MNLFANRIPASALRSADIFYSTFGRLTYQSKRATRAQRFLTVHDMLPRIMPELFTPNQCAVHARIINSVGPRDWVVCVSESTRNDLCRLADVRPEQTFVIPPGSSSDRFYPCADPERRAAVRAKYGIPAGRYLLSVATLEPRKNLAFLVRCFARWTRETGAEDLCLVLAGGQGWKYDAIERVLGEVGELRGRIILTGYVDDQDLAPLYSECLAFVYPSLYEGFGLPVLEAMKCGAAILSSASSSIPEVIGDAGMLVDPRDESAMCQALDRLCGDANLRSEMSARALQRATEFSWSACVDKHLAAFRHALASRPS
jgi:glycosyltransferase involved in cell wall biosynthesis